MFKAKTIMFDLDGTLIDSVPDLAWSIDRMCDDLALPRRGPDQVRLWVGNGVRMLIRRAIAGSVAPCPESDRVDDALERFTAYHADHCCVDSRLYPKTIEALEQLTSQGLKLALITNKMSRFTDITLEHFGIKGYFDLVLSFESLPTAKPSPEPLLAAMDRLGRPGVFVGDSETDILSARNADVPVICMSYGYNHGIPIEELAPDSVIDQLDELADLVRLC